MSIHWRGFLTATGAAASLLAAAAPALAETGAGAVGAMTVERQYCTQFGPFFLRFDPDKAAGVFAIRANNDLGSVVGEMSGQRFDGRWIEVDSHGAIRIVFSDDWSQFEAEYNVHQSPDDWRGGWLGRISPDDRPDSFNAEGGTFYCR